MLTFKLLPASAPSGYNLLFLHKGVLIPTDVYPLVLNVAVSDFREIVVDQSVVSDAPCRVGHSSALHNGCLYVWGGADRKLMEYTNGMLVLKEVEASVQKSFLYSKAITIGQSAVDLSGAEETFPLVFEVNTKELFDAGRVLPNCKDVMFALGGKPLFYFMDPHPGCNSEKSVFYLKLSTKDKIKVKVKQIVQEPSQTIQKPSAAKSDPPSAPAERHVSTRRACTDFGTTASLSLLWCCSSFQRESLRGRWVEPPPPLTLR